MKWFQHYSNSHESLKDKRILREFGVCGIGLKWLCCELVAKEGKNFRVKSEKDWQSSLQDVSKLEKDEQKKILDFFADINTINKKSFEVGDLHIPQMREYSDDYTKKRRRVSGQGTDSVG